MSKPKVREQTYCSKYSEDFSFITASKVSNKHAFCKPCRRDILISHGGRADIVQHSKSKVHIRNMNAEAEVSSHKQQSILAFQSKPDDDSAIRAECMFASFYLEHNIPISVADHMTKLLKAAFPNSEEIKKFSAGRTKTSHIIKELAADATADFCNTLKVVPFSIATDGSHTNDAKLYPIIITYPDTATKTVRSQLLSVPALKESSSGHNIGKLLLSELESHGIPISNCIAMGSDNAPVMVGKKSGVLACLWEEQPNLISIGCPCHLINLAAQHAASILPLSVDTLLIDVFYYMEGSVNRKHKLEAFQEMCGVETQRILKHVCTRWLSLGLCLPRFIKQWEALEAFFKAESSSSVEKDAHSKTPLMQAFTIPKKNFVDNSKKRKNDSETNCPPQKKRNTTDSSSKVNTTPSQSQSQPSIATQSRAQKILTQLESPLHKAFSHFLQFSIGSFEKANTILQTSSPLIHTLKYTLDNFLKQQLAAFVKPAVILNHSGELRYLDYKDKNNHKKDIDISIGNSTFDVVSLLSESDLLTFFTSVKRYYIKACDYIVSKFPNSSDVLNHAQVADIHKRGEASFSSLRFFFSKFPVLVKRDDGESLDDAINQLEVEFNNFCVDFTFGPNHHGMAADKFWFSILDTINGDGSPKYQKLSFMMLGILTIPHSNAECERIFSSVRKNKTDFRGSLSHDMLSALLVQKSRMASACYEQNFSQALLKKAKAATRLAFNKE